MKTPSNAAPPQKAGPCWIRMAGRLLTCCTSLTILLTTHTFCVFQQAKAAMARSHSTDSEDNYVPMNPGSSSLLSMEKTTDNAQGLYIPMSPGPHHLDILGLSSASLPVHKGGAIAQCHRRLSEIQPPPVNRNLKPDRKGNTDCSDEKTSAMSAGTTIIIRLLALP